MGILFIFGCWHTHLNSTNWISFFCFEIALIFHSIAMFMFNFQFLKFTKSIQLNKMAHYIAFISDSLFPFLLTDIALTPCDLVLPIHMNFVYAAFSTLIPLSFSYTLLIHQHHILPNKYNNVLLIIVIAIALYILIILFKPNPKTTPYVQQTTQKIIVYSIIFNLLYLTKKYIQFLSIKIKTSIIEHK